MTRDFRINFRITLEKHYINLKKILEIFGIYSKKFLEYFHNNFEEIKEKLRRKFPLWKKPPCDTLQMGSKRHNWVTLV